MKTIKGMKIITLATLTAFSYGQFIYGQNEQPARNLEAADREVVPANLGQNDKASAVGDSGSAEASDAGAQRPVKLKKKGISTYFGYNSKYFYRSNPTMSGTELKKQQTGMWTNTFFAGSGLGVFETDSSVITPYVGASWTLNDYIEGGLDALNYNSTGAYALLLAQYGNGWSARAGLNYAADSSTENDTEDYREYFPNIGAMKAYNLSDSVLGIFNAGLGKHITTADSFFNTSTNELDNWEFSASYGFNWKLSENFRVDPKYRASYKIYDNGDNKDRDDFTNMLSLRLAYSMTNSVTIDFTTAYTNRSASGAKLPSDFKNLDTGGGLSLNARF
jgi:hypothetical protein